MMSLVSRATRLIRPPRYIASLTDRPAAARGEWSVLGESDLGHRVVVRHRTPLGLTDVLGELTIVDEGRLVVRTETGAEVEIARPDVIAGKPVGPRPPRYSEILAL